MIEYFTKGLIIARDERGEFDETAIVYTKDLGKISAAVRGVRRIKSKLSAHLGIGSVSNLRIIKKNNFQIVDALSISIGLNQEKLRFIDFINQMTPYEMQDLHLWHGVEYVISKNLMGETDRNSEELRNRVYRRFLELLGFGARFAKCANCGSKDIVYFLPPDIMFLCPASFKKLGVKEENVIKI